jgi:hypothetical protein
MRQSHHIRGAKQEMSFFSRPKDPVWSSTPHLERVRARLSQQFDGQVTVWWAASRERWRLMEWSNGGGFWRPVCFWEGPGGEYREPDAEGMVNELGRRMADGAAALRKVEAHNERVEREKGREFREANDAYMADISARAMGIRQTFAPGMIRSRNWLKGEVGGSHRRMVADHLIKAWEERNGRRWEGPGS